MSRSTDPGHFFQTDSSLSESTRKQAKSKNSAGSPIRLSSKLLAVAPDPDDSGRVYVAEAAGNVRRVDIEAGETSALYSGPVAPLASLAVSNSTPRTVFAGCWDKTIWSWDAETKQQKQRYHGHGDFVKALLCITVAGRELLISGGADAKILIWDVKTGELLGQLKGHARGILALAVDPLSLPEPGQKQEDAEVTIFSADSTRELRRWKISAKGGSISAAEVSESLLVPHATSVNSIFFDASADADLWTASADKTCKCLSRSRNWETDTELVHPDFVRDVVVDEDGGWVVTACRDEEVRVWEKGSGSLYHTFTGHFEEVTGLVLLPGQKLISVSIDATVRRWSLKPQDVQKAKEEAAKPKDADDAKKEAKKESLLTEEEERELAELMDDSD